MPPVADRRLVITREMLPPGDGDNITGPSVIATPSWLPGRSGAYMMYFAHHTGKYIRVAFADHPLGPWTVYAPGSLSLSDCPAVRGHIASPDVHIDDARRRIVMYFHGPHRRSRRQKSFVAVSPDGLAFLPSPKPLGIFYFRVWRRRDVWYALGKARLYRSADGLSAFEEGPVVFAVPGSNPEAFAEAGNIRHTAVDPEGDSLTVYYTRIGDAPERILRGRIDMARPWTQWRLEGADPVLAPGEPWEGANLPVRPSMAGPATGPVNELRDPCILRTAGRTYLYYCAAGETAIAAGELKG